MAGNGFRGVDTAAMGGLAEDLQRRAGELRSRGGTIAALFEKHGKREAAAEMAAVFNRIDQWAADRGRDLLWRRDLICRGQNAGPATGCALGSLDPWMRATFAAVAVYDPSNAEQAYCDWVVNTYPAVAVSELRDVQGRIDGWSGSDNDPILDQLIRRAAMWRDAFAVGEATMVEVAAAMGEGLSPAEAGLPEYVFPPDYLAELGTYRRHLEEIARLQQRQSDLMMDIFHSGAMPGEAHALEEELDRVTGRLEETQAQLVEPDWDAARIHEHLLSTALLDSAGRQRAAGVYLAGQIHPDGEGIEDLPAITALLQDASGLESRAFYDTLGPDTTAGLPGMITQSGATTEEARTALRAFSEALGDASRVGLDFTGADLIAPENSGYEAWYRRQGDAALLFLYGEFADDFIVDASLYPLQHPEEFPDGWVPGTAVFDLVDAETVDIRRLSDVRLLLFGRIAEQGSGTAAAFVTAADQLGLLDDFLYPESVFHGPDPFNRWGYDDQGVYAGAIVAELATETEAARAVVAAIAEGGPADLGIAAGAEIMFTQHLTALIQPGQGEGLATPQSPLADMGETLDEFLHVLFLSGAGEVLQVQAENLVAAEITMELETNPETAYDQISYFKTDPLGELVGRIEAARITAGAELAARADEVNDARATVVGLLSGAGVSLALPASVLLPAAVAVGAAADVGTGGLTDHLLPQDHLAIFWEHEYEVLLDRGQELDLTMLQMLFDAGMVEAQEWSEHTYVEGHKLRDWGNLLQDIYDRADTEVDPALRGL